jgi:hypothetical protein
MICDSTTDPQQQAVYEIGAVLRRRFSDCWTEAEAVHFVEKLVASEWWLARGGIPVRVEFLGNVRAPATSDWHAGVVCLPDWAVHPTTIAHELAHQITPRWHPTGFFQVQNHGPTFVAAWVDIAERWLSEYAGSLAGLLTNNGLRTDGVEHPMDSQRGISDRWVLPDGTVHSYTQRFDDRLMSEVRHWPAILEHMRERIADVRAASLKKATTHGT